MRSLRRFASPLLVITLSACYFPDREAIQEKMYSECRLVPAGPQCACAEGPDAPACDYVFDQYLRNSIQSAAEEECILDAECSGGDTTPEQLESLEECARLDRALDLDPGHLGKNRDPECVAACSNELNACGPSGVEACGVDVTAACFDEYDACREACWPAG